MVTRNLKCPRCGCQEERTAIGMKEPDRYCNQCADEADVAIPMKVMPNAVAGFKLRGQGFHAVDYPKSNEQKIKDYGLKEHDSTDPNSDYHQDGYAEEMVSKVPGTGKPKG